MGGNLPFIPGVYQPNSTIAELILKAGQERARSQERLGQTISDSLLNIGAAAQQGFAQRQRTQNEQKIQGAVSAGIASPDSFETALQALPPEIRTQARKEYSDASDAAARIAERHAKTAQDQAMTLKARHDLEQKNMDDMGTIAFRAQGHASDDDGGLSAMLAATHALKSKGVMGAENFDGPLQDLVANWQKAVASNDPAQIKAAADQNRAAGKATFDHILMNVSPEHMKALMGEEPKLVPIGPKGLYNTQTKETIGGGPEPITPQQAATNAAAAARLAEEQRHNRVTEAGAEAAPTLTPAALDMAALVYKKTGQPPAMGMGKAGATVRQAVMNRAATLTPEDEARIVAGGTDVAGNKAAYGADAASMKALQKNVDAVTAFESTATKNAALLNEVMKNVPDLGSKFLNRPIRALAGNLGSEDIAKLDAIRQSVSNEYSRIISNPTLAGTMSDSARKEGEALLSPGATAGQIKSALAILASEAHNRKTSYQGQLDAIKGRMSGQTQAEVPATPAVAPAATGGGLDAFLAKFGNQ